ncbi:BamA/TamA family outer membrane protein [Pontibacter sp. 172403-2]|uniref:translocation and assembly module lipoprotein TamL n=1 Tax=Pontibacter rufus TaxID=2791028 RepID=UPI0018AFA56E|nr:BamA/TamA family outer membrane protein [Pontibacter sp. 172403-2]MBF9253693.1 BamA/TamA family outer membrane protein [Pontibacter sp. 172403-2]
MTTTIPRKLLLPRYTMLPVLLLVLFSGCNITKTVPEGDALFAGYKVKVKGEKDSSNREGELETSLTEIVHPKPNASILGLRPKLWIYNTFYTEKEKGIKHWIQTKFGEPPVLLSAVDTSSINATMGTFLENKGYFNNTVASQTTVENKMATIDWTAFVSEPYRIRKIEYTLNDSLPVQHDINQTRPGSLLLPGDPYDLQTMMDERTRIDQQLKEEGYFYFSPDLLIFSVDTTIGNRQADVLLRLKNSAPAQSLQPYTIDDVYIFANYTLGDSLGANDTIDVRGYHYIPDENYVKAKYLLKSVFLKKDSLYARQDHLLTTSRLMGLPAYKFVNINYEQDTTQNNKLDTFIYLTPAFKKSLRAEAKMVSKSNNFAGPGLTISFRNRNAFKGSELLNVEFTGNFESQVGGRVTSATAEGEDASTKSGLNSYEVGVQTTLTFPRIVSPFKLHNLRTEFVPKTRMALGFDFLNRVQYFQMNSFNASYAYNWRPRKTITHDVTPINLQYVQLSNRTEAFNTILAERPYLERSFQNQFIIGSIYQLTYSTQMFENRTHQFFDNLTVDVSGNLLNAAQSLGGTDAPTEDLPRTIFGQAYSQYTLVQNDFRYYLNLTEESQLVTRLAVGVGYPYGNSTTLPYVKQFSIGGPNSIRAFRARSVGPGTYNIPDSLATSYFDQLGDIKLEANLEYRFPIVGFFKGAVFVDAGNIWLINESVDANGEPDRKGGKFEAKDFMSELAIGTGVGLRIDVGFFVIRLDLGIPVQVPYLPKGERFVLGDFNPTFSGENSMVLNIGIGYPF